MSKSLFGTFRDHGFVGFRTAIVLDVETTGLDPKSDRIISIYAIEVVDFESMVNHREGNVRAFERLFNPEIPIPSAATEIHGIMDQDVVNSDKFAEHADQLREFIGSWPIVSHNVQFDEEFLNAEFKRAGVKTLHRNRSYCTMNRMRELLGYTNQGFINVTLDQTAQKFSISGRTGAFHSAQEDANLTMQVAACFYEIDNRLTPSRTTQTSSSKEEI